MTVANSARRIALIAIATWNKLKVLPDFPDRRRAIASDFGFYERA
jgi:hypothetical protein